MEIFILRNQIDFESRPILKEVYFLNFKYFLDDLFIGEQALRWVWNVD